MDPLSLAGQRAASLIKLIRDNLHFSQTILFAPRTDLSAFPLQNFYRYVISPHDSEKAVASFANLPRQHVLTVRTDIPEPWNVQAKSAMQVCVCEMRSLIMLFVVILVVGYDEI